MDSIDFNSLTQRLWALSAWAAPLAILCGALLWLAGSKLVRFMCGGVGLVAGALVGMVVAHVYTEHHTILIWVLATAVLSCIFAWLIFRMGMGLSLALALALLGPLYGLSFKDKPLPPIVTPPAELIESLPLHPGGPAASDPDAVRFDPDPADAHIPSDHPVFANPPSAISSDSLAAALDTAQTTRTLQDYLIDQAAQLRQWWTDLGPASQLGVVCVALLGLAVGMVAGLIFPAWAAALQTSLLAALLLLWGADRLCEAFFQRRFNWFALDQHAFLLTVLLITLSGSVAQRILWPEKKED